VGRLASPDECRDARSLTEPPPPPAGSQAAIEAISRQLAEAKALYAAGRYAGARPPAAAATEAARRLGYAPLVAEAAYLEARVAMVLAEGDRAEKLYEEAILAGIEGRTDELAARVAVEYVHAVGVERARPADAHERAKLAAALIGRLGRPELLSAELDAAIGSVYRAEGKPAEAKLHLERAVPIIERTHGVDSLDLARVYNQLGILHFTQGRYAEAAGWFDRVRWIRVARQGPDHPQVGNVLVNLGVMQTHTGRHAEATATFERALAILEPKIGPHHVTLVKLNNNIGLLLARQGRYEEALARHEQAYAIYRNVAGATEVDSAATLINTALAQRNLGRIAEAKELNRRVMAIYEKAFGPGHPDLAYPLIELALCLLAEGKPDEAIPLLRRSRVVREGNEEDPAERAEAELALARALWDAGRDRKEAIEQAARARDHYAEAEKTDPSYGKERAAAESWLAAHTAP
jgi:serine/threonine-protein kinase